MKFSNSKGSVKVNQILLIVKEHSGNNITLAHIKLMTLMIHELYIFSDHDSSYVSIR